MELLNLAASRPAWYDRNPVTKRNYYAAVGLAPHADTQRWVYTVPAAKKFVVQTVDVHCTRVTAAAPVGRVWNYINLTPNGGAAGGVLTRFMWGNNVGDHLEGVIGGQPTLLAGDVLEGHTRDEGTGGTVDYANETTGVEFDA